MNRLKGKKKRKSLTLELIGPALIPAAALTAVPSSPPPQHPPGTPLGLASQIFGSSFPLHHGQAIGDSAEGVDPEDSGSEFDEMEEAGYSSVTFRTAPNQKRISYSDRDRVPTPTFVTVRNASTEEFATQSGELYHILESSAADHENQSDIYALPTKGRSLGRKKEPEDEEAASMDRTRRDVRLAMQAIHDTPVEETMMRLSGSREADSSGRGTMKGGFEDDHDDDDDKSEEAPPLPPPYTSNNNASEEEVIRDPHTEESPYSQVEAVVLHQASSPHYSLAGASPRSQTSISVQHQSEASSHLQSEASPHPQTEEAVHHQIQPSQLHHSKLSPFSLKKKSSQSGKEASPHPEKKVSLSSGEEISPPSAKKISPPSGKKISPPSAEKISPPGKKISPPSAKKMSSSSKQKESPSSKQKASSRSKTKASAKHQTEPKLRHRAKASSHPQAEMSFHHIETPSHHEEASSPHDEEASSHHRTKAIAALQQEMDTPRSAGASGTAQLSGLSNTPRDVASLSLQMEVERIKEENHQLYEEIVGLRKVAAAVQKDDKEAAQSQIQNHHVHKLKEENEVLKNTVGRLNQELSRYQAKFRPLSADDTSKLQSLPGHGPVPSWLVNKRYLAPLFLSYDDLVREKDEMIQRCQRELQTLKNRTEEVVRENQRHQLQGTLTSTRGQEVISASSWQQLQDQARLVLEENQVLVEQLDVQQSKVKDLYSSHILEMNRLTRKMTASETEKEEVERELEEIRCKFQDVKIRYDRALLELGNHMTMQDHINTVADLKRSVTEEKEQFEKEKEKMEFKLLASDEERKRQTLASVELQVENKQLRAEIGALHKTIRRSRNKMLLLQKAVKQSESMELVTQNELANVIKIVEKTALERDTALRMAKEQQRDAKDTVNQMVGNGAILGKMEEKLRAYKLRASTRLETIAEKLKEQDDSFNRQRQEYEREICYLHALLKEKEKCLGDMKGEKKHLEEGLEVMWQAASSENQRLKDTLSNSVQKLREHSSLKTALDEEDELEKLLHFS